MPVWASALIGVGIIIALVFLFILGYTLNKKTPVPEGCEDILADCQGCGVTSCSLHRPSADKVEVI